MSFAAARNLIQYQLVIPTQYYIKNAFYLRIMYDIFFIELIYLLCKHISSWSEECLKVLKPFIYIVNIYKKSRHESLFLNSQPEKNIFKLYSNKSVFSFVWFSLFLPISDDFYLCTRTEQELNSLYNICKILIHIKYGIF